jgi:hypothetical protein
MERSSQKLFESPLLYVLGGIHTQKDTPPPKKISFRVSIFTPNAEDSMDNTKIKIIKND